MSVLPSVTGVKLSQSELYLDSAEKPAKAITLLQDSDTFVRKSKIFTITLVG